MRKRMRFRVHTFLFALLTSSSAFFILTEIFIGTALSSLSFLVFLKLSRGILSEQMFDFDRNVSYVIYSIRSPFLTGVMFFLSFLGNDLIILTSIFIIILLIIRKHKHEAYLFILMLGMGVVINTAIKALIARPRPHLSPLTLESFYSFPSGHTMNSFVFYMCIAFFIFRFTRSKILGVIVSTLAICVIFLIGLSRVYLGVHYPTDVLAGFVGGFWWFVTALVLEKSIYFFELFRLQKTHD